MNFLQMAHFIFCGMIFIPIYFYENITNKEIEDKHNPGRSMLAVAGLSGYACLALILLLFALAY